jgi:ribosomal protein S1
LSFSLKQAGTDPWKSVGERYARDMVVKGVVTRVVDFGAFVELEPGLEGLVHVSEMAEHRVKSPGEVVKEGQDVQARVLEVDEKTRRISLSMRRVEEAVSAEPTPAQPGTKPKKRKTELRGGLDWNW